MVLPSIDLYTSSSLTAFDSMAANRFARTYAFGNTSAQYRPGGFVRKMSSLVQFGATPQAFLGNDNYCAISSSNPTDQWYWNLATVCPAQNTAATITCQVCIDYDIEWFARGPSSLDLMTRLKNNRRLKSEFDRKDQKDRGRALTAGGTTTPVACVARSNPDEGKDKKSEPVGSSTISTQDEEGDTWGFASAPPSPPGWGALAEKHGRALEGKRPP